MKETYTDLIDKIHRKMQFDLRHGVLSLDDFRSIGRAFDTIAAYLENEVYRKTEQSGENTRS